MSGPRMLGEAVLVLAEPAQNVGDVGPRVVDVVPVAPEVAHSLQSLVVGLRTKTYGRISKE